MVSNLLNFRLKGLGSRSQASVLYVSGPRGDAELLFSYGELIGIAHAGVCHHLAGLRRTSNMHVNQWVGERSSAERGIGEFQNWLNAFFGSPRTNGAAAD